MIKLSKHINANFWYYKYKEFSENFWIIPCIQKMKNMFLLMLLSDLANILVNMKNWYSRHNRQKWCDWLDEYLRNSYEALPILTKFLINLMINSKLICWISCESFTNVINTYECCCKSFKCLWKPYKWNDYTMCDCQGFLFVTYCQHPPSELLVSNVKLLSFIMPKGQKKGQQWQRQGQGKVWPSSFWTQRLCFRRLSIQWWPDQEDCGLNWQYQNVQSEQGQDQVCQCCQEAQARKRGNQVVGDVKHLVRPLTFPHFSPTLSDCTSSISAPYSVTARPPSKAKKFTVNKPGRHSAKLTNGWNRHLPSTTPVMSRQMAANLYICLMIITNACHQ